MSSSNASATGFPDWYCLHDQSARCAIMMHIEQSLSCSYCNIQPLFPIQSRITKNVTNRVMMKTRTTMTRIMAKIFPGNRFELRSSFRQSGNFETRLLAQRLELLKKLFSYARLSIWLGILPESLFDDKFSVVNFRFPISGGISPENWLSDKSRLIKCGNDPKAAGIFPKSLFLDRFMVVNDFHDMISDGNSPERLFPSRKSEIRFEREVNSFGISPENRLFPPLNSARDDQVPILRGISPEN